ncbi:MAG TPA: hypothetical protein DGN60_07880 [Chloroflexi bacterium]|nr:hypothetical protein [Chloroflexota bacterium]|tara:strand:- start:3089 stop:3436 length:348 start_codon:yes stop_codon:yes gene_type:complete
MTNLQTTLDNVRTVAHNHNLKYRLEFLYENDIGARIRLALVLLHNESNYHRTLVEGKGFSQDMQSILEEELVIELTKKHNAWTASYEQTVKPTSSKPGQLATQRIIGEINQALKA